MAIFSKRIVNIGSTIKKGELIGYIKTVLKEDKGLPMTMLHIELYKHGYNGNGEWWYHNTDKPEMLLNSEKLFKNLIMSDYKKGLPPLKERDKRDGTRLISEWYTVLTTDGEEKAYYHIFQGWMIKGEPECEWRFGYKPINKTVEGWR